MNKFKVGDIVKFTDNTGLERVGIVYENGNKSFEDYRVELIGTVKVKLLSENNLTEATPAEFANDVAATIQAFTPGFVIFRETHEAGGALPEALLEKPVYEAPDSKDVEEDD
jgi:hypothetical protein